MILLTTVVFPEPVPPAIPIINISDDLILTYYYRKDNYFWINFKIIGIFYPPNAES